MAMRTDTGSKSTRNVEQHSSRPQRADAAREPGLVPGGELAQFDAPVQRGREIAHERPEVDPVRRGEVDRDASGVVDVVDAADLHRQVVLADELARSHPRGRPLLAAGLRPRDVVRAGHSGQNGQAADVVADVLRRPHDLGDLGTVLGRVKHVVANTRRERSGVGVVQPPLPLEHHGADHPHLRSLALARPPASARSTDKTDHLREDDPHNGGLRAAWEAPRC